MDKRKITFGFILHDKEVIKDYYGPSLEAMYNYYKNTYDIEIIKTESIKANPAKNYNDIIRASTSKYIVLTHTDVTFSQDLIENIFNTIDAIPNFGALGIVGVCSEGKYHWAKKDKIQGLETLDCCCIIINKDHGIFFDETTFDEFHLYVEDYCCSVNSNGFGCYTVLTDAGEVPPVKKYRDMIGESFFNHHSVTFNERGACWGRYNEFKELLNKKWGKKIRTT